MKSVLPLLLALPGTISAPAPSVKVQVAFSPLTKAAYLAAKKGRIATKPLVTFPLKKQHGRIVVPTAKGE